MLMPEDNYFHPTNGIYYIKESILGPGGDIDAFHTWFGVTCSCPNKKACYGDGCKCLVTFSKNYISGLLVDEKLNGGGGVYECSAFCSCNGKCLNKVVQRGPSPELEIRSVEDKGLGVFSLGTILKGSFICEYAGEIIGKTEAIKLSKKLETSKYLMTLREHFSNDVIETYIDACTFGNIGRYVNHSCEPNCVVISVRAGCLIPKLALFAIRTIRINEELSYSYCPGSKKLSETKCYCTALNCRGFLPVDDM